MRERPISDDPVGSLSRRRWIIRQVVYREVLDALDRIFSAYAIEYMPIKGAHLICTSLSEKFASREMIDIDLLVRRVDFTRAVAALGSHPLFSREAPDPWPFEQSFRFMYGNHRIHFELHCALNRPERFTFDTDALFGRAEVQTAFRRIMAAEDALIVLICHTLVHLIDGIREQVFTEAMLLLQERGFSWERFSARLPATGIERFGKALLVLAAGKKGIYLPASINTSWWALALLKIKTPGRGKGMFTALFRCGVELAFVKKPMTLWFGYLQRRRRQYHAE